MCTGEEGMVNKQRVFSLSTWDGHRVGCRGMEIAKVKFSQELTAMSALAGSTVLSPVRKGRQVRASCVRAFSQAAQ